MSDNLPKELIVNPSSVKDIKVIVKEAIKASKYEDTGFEYVSFEGGNAEYGVEVQGLDTVVIDKDKFAKALIQVQKGNMMIGFPMGNYTTLAGDGVQYATDKEWVLNDNESIVLAIYPSIQGGNDTNVITMYALTLWNNDGKYILQELEF